MPQINKKNNSQYWTLNTLVDRFYTSRFNRDNMHCLNAGEDIDNSRAYRVYNKGDVKELIQLFTDYLAWVINAENVSKIRLSEDIALIRETKTPKLKRANIVDEIITNGRVKAGQLYVTNGKYAWTMFLSGDTYEKMTELTTKDPELARLREEAQKRLEERIKKDESNN